MDLHAANFWFPKWLGYWYVAIWTFLVFLVEMGLEPLKTAAGLRRIPSENQFIRRIASDFFFVFFLGIFRFLWCFSRVFVTFVCFWFLIMFLVLFSCQAARRIILYGDWRYRWELQVPPSALSSACSFRNTVWKTKSIDIYYMFVLVTMIRRGKEKYDIFSCAAYVRNVHVFAEEWRLNDL